MMLRRRGEALSRGQLLEGAWELGFESRSNLVDVYVRYLRDKKGDEVALHVLDSGPGLPEHFAARALDRFSRADGARSAVGAGRLPAKASRSLSESSRPNWPRLIGGLLPSHRLSRPGHRRFGPFWRPHWRAAYPRRVKRAWVG